MKRPKALIHSHWKLIGTAVSVVFVVTGLLLAIVLLAVGDSLDRAEQLTLEKRLLEEELNTIERKLALIVHETVHDYANWMLYETEEYRIRYPEGYSVRPITSGIQWTTISGPAGSIEIWDTDELPERPMGFSGVETDEEVEAVLPRLEGILEFGAAGQKTIRVHFERGDIASATELYDILATFEVYE